MNPLLMCDFYKISHRIQYPTGTNKVYSNFTPRNSKYDQQTEKQEQQGLLKTVYVDGNLFVNTNIACIRRMIEETIL
jgi:nicotinamide phosphoribosyltransferase